MANRSVHVLIVVALSAAGCAGSRPLRSTLDERGLTLLSAENMLTLARAAPRFSSTARDYLYVAPVETNDAGLLRHYLWLGLGSTVDRAWGWSAPSKATTIVFLLDDLPLALSLTDWDTEPGPSLFDIPAPVYQIQRAQLTLDELARITTAKSIDVEIATGDGAVARYRLWRGAWADWRAFVAEVEPQRDRQRR